ncbi:unnamed protein product [Rotaria magnacalcarata]|uniref:Nuclear receptor domain-containing protein n=1 Tax=Rotaria magnacalcarata TaxID=392030 RepID=A0A819F469_9BILA|nr:unnamed protein product [Rotaria magnacalcarata]CAF1681661.1 unnamed protein product [Rotaria magnacalcarata]CAF2015426.1 unnamed protein product [Rotaria magnacalcarata]CAF2144827.1 unnamed protein product [Rotaria magnacalcarata]CAF3860369.1 unnamed protein product [Rotaria magnacalcarata]
MANETKMIIITSNEDLIRQFSLNKTNNTLIIDLDNEKKMVSKRKNNNNNNNIIDLALLAELSELNSTSDQVYKRVLDSPDQNRSKPVKISKKSMDLICTICGDRAIGFNYDALSCASCKAFFRRNAHQSREKLRCLTGQDQCSVTYEMRRKCQRCRLDRCFAMGMRKDFILSEQEKQRRRKRLEENRSISSKPLLISESSNLLSLTNLSPKSESFSETFDEIDRLLMDMDNDDDDDHNVTPDENMKSNATERAPSTMFSLQDRITIQNIGSSFISSFQTEDIRCSSFDVSDRASALISWSRVANEIALRFISFFRQIDEFESLHADDRFILIKYNLLPLFPIVRCYKYRPINGPCSDAENEKNEKRCRFFMLCDESNVVRDMFVNLVLSLVEITEQDPTLLSLILSILIFSQGLSMNENEPPLKDSIAVNRAQFYYTKLLWHYWLDKYGEIETHKRFAQLLKIILRIQSAAKKSREFFRFQFMTSNTVDKVEPLMQSVLHIS